MARTAVKNILFGKVSIFYKFTCFVQLVASTIKLTWPDKFKGMNANSSAANFGS